MNHTVESPLARAFLDGASRAIQRSTAYDEHTLGLRVKIGELPQEARNAVYTEELYLYAYWYAECRHCKQERKHHLDGVKCLFEPTEFDP